MKLEINRLIIENGQPKEIELFGEEYILKPKKEAEIPQEPKIKNPVKVKTPEKRVTRPEGRVVPRYHHIIDSISNVSIKQDILDMIKQIHIDDIPAQRALIKRYNPNLNYKSVSKYLWAYRKKLGWHARSPRGSFVPKEMVIPYRHKRRRRIKPDGAVAYSKSYHMWIRDEDIQKVTLGVNKFELDYKPTYETLLKETKMAKSRLLATLRHMREQGKLNLVRSDRGAIYQPVIRMGEENG